MVYLKIYLQEEIGVSSDYESFENINNFKSLRYLYIGFFHFEKTFLLKLKTLKLLLLEQCNNISLSEDCYSNIKRLMLLYTTLNSDSKSLYKLPQLEYGEFYEDAYSFEYNSIIDFKSLASLKYYKGVDKDFIQLESLSLEDITIFANMLTKDFEIKIIEKVLSLKKLKKLRFILNKINERDISKNTRKE